MATRRLTDLPARVLVASRPYPRPPDDVDLDHPLAAFTPEQVYTLPDSPHAVRDRDLADREITQLLRRTDDDLALKVLGLLTAAHGPLSVADLTWLTGSLPWEVRRVLEGEAARTLQQVGPEHTPRYSFAHKTLLDRCQQEGVGGRDHVLRIRDWAAKWRDRSWPAARDGTEGTPLYLLDNYPQALRNDPPLLTALVGDASWVTAAIRVLGVDAVLGELKTADAAAASEPRLAAMHAVVRGQAYYLRGPEAADDPGFVPRQLCLQAAELGETALAAGCEAQQLACDDPGPVLQWTTRRASPALTLELGRDEFGVSEVAVLPGGRLVTGSYSAGRGGKVLVWDPGQPGTDPIELGRSRDGVSGAGVLPDGRIVTCNTGYSGPGASSVGRLLVWDPEQPGTDPVELGRDEHGAMSGVAVLPGGRVVTIGGGFGGFGKVLVWDPGHPGTDPVELGYDMDGPSGVAVLPDGRVATGSRDILFGRGGRVLVWDPGQPGTDPVELGRDEHGVSGVAVLPDGRVVTGGKRVLIWDPEQPGSQPIELTGDEVSVSAVAVLPDGRVVTGGGGDSGGRVLVWDPEQPGSQPIELTADEVSVSAVAVLPDGRVVTGSPDSLFHGGGRLLVWDVGAAHRNPTELTHDKLTVRAVAVLPDGRAVTGSVCGRVLVWDPAQPGTGPVELGRDEDKVSGVAVLPDGRVVTGGKRVLIWDPGRPGTGPVELGRDEESLNAMRVGVLPDGRVVTHSSSERVLVWDPARPGSRPVELGRHSTGGVTAIAVLPDGQVVTGGLAARGVTGRPGGPLLVGDLRKAGGFGQVVGQLLMWDPARHGSHPVELGRDEDSVGAVGVLPDGRVVTGGGGVDGRARVLVWDPAQPGTDPIELGCDIAGVTAIAVLPDGHVVTGGGVSDRVRVWNVQSGSPGALLESSAYTLATSGTRLFIGHVVGGISCWEVCPGAPADIEHTRAPVTSG